jgi:DNA polymerase-1
MKRLIFDLETNGLLPDVSEIHCMAVKDVDTGVVQTFTSNSVKDCLTEGLRELQNADVLIGHNIIKYDIPVITKLYPWFQNVLDHPNAPILMDTLVLSRLIWPEIRNDDFRLRERRPEFPGKMIGRHSLESWGHRLGNYKGDYSGGWGEFNQEMLEYCVQDVKVTASLWDLIQTKDYSIDAIKLEHDFVRCIQKQETVGFRFNDEQATQLYVQLGNRKRHLGADLKKAFPSWEIRTPFTPKVNSKKYGYTKGVPTEKVKVINFNPASRDHIADRLIKKYSWSPKLFTQEGKPQIDETVLNNLPYPEAKLLSEYLMLDKRLGMLGEGRQAWLKLQRNGRIHGTVTTNGAVTGRCTHQRPNVAQVPSMKVAYGRECRKLFTTDYGYKLVGCDASGIELRCLAHYMARYDGGAYVKELLTGDIHSANQRAAGLPTRDNAKTFIYAFLYGAGDAKIGSIVGGGVKEGKRLRKEFLSKTPALKQLRDGVVKKVQMIGYLKGIDGRILTVRSTHSALNTLLQSAGGLLVKTATVILHDLMKQEGYIWNKDWAMVAHIHDEMQLQVREGLETDVGVLAVKSIVKAGEHYKFRCPLNGEYKVGENWAETH